MDEHLTSRSRASFDRASDRLDRTTSRQQGGGDDWKLRGFGGGAGECAPYPRLHIRTHATHSGYVLSRALRPALHAAPASSRKYGSCKSWKGG
eukprot:5450294-Prymnesium_polylepis.1